MVGDPGQKDKLGDQALVESGLAKGKSDKEVMVMVMVAHFLFTYSNALYNKTIYD